LAVETIGLCKSFGDVHSLRDCSLSVPTGAAFGLLGPNGAGKSTLIRTLLGFVRPTRGAAHVLGKDVVRESLAIRERVSYLPGDARLYRSMRGSSVIDMFAQMHPRGDRQSSRSVADRLGLEVRRRVAFMSTGMRQKLALSIILGSRAPLLILDEPTANLDPDVRNEVLALVREANQSGQTVLLSSHLFTDIERTCSEVALLRDGRIVATELLSERESRHIVTATTTGGTDQIRIPDEANFDIVRKEQPSARIAQGKPASHEGSEYTENPESNHNLVLEIVGSPNDWMPWLSKLNLDNITITMANVETFYDSFSRPKADATDPPMTEGTSDPSSTLDPSKPETA